MTDLGLPIKNSSNHIIQQGLGEEGKSICRYGERRIEKGEDAVDKSNTHKQEAAEARSGRSRERSMAQEITENDVHKDWDNNTQE